MTRFRSALVLTTCLIWLLAATAGAQDLRGFTKSDDYVMQLDEASGGGDVYWSQTAGAFLLISRGLSTPVLIKPGQELALAVPVIRLARNSSGAIDILSGEDLAPIAPFEVGEDGVVFGMEGHRVRMMKKPPLLGWQESSDIEAYASMYSERAAAYHPQEAVIADLRSHASDVRVIVFFGSWCPFCQQRVPLAIRVAHELEGSGVDFDFYGLEHGFADDRVAAQYGVKSVPTGIVLVAGKEVGRLQGDAWASPEASLNRILTD